MRITRTFTTSNEYPDDVRAAIVAGEDDPFGLANLKLEWLPKDWHVFIYEGGEVGEDGEVVAHVGLVRTEVEVGGERVGVGGYGGVLTRASARGKGHARAALEVADRHLRDEGVRFGFLFCRPQLVAYYAALGWQELQEEVEIQQPDGPRPFPGRAMVKPLSAESWPGGRVRLTGLPW